MYAYLSVVFGRLSPDLDVLSAFYLCLLRVLFFPFLTTQWF